MNAEFRVINPKLRETIQQGLDAKRAKNTAAGQTSLENDQYTLFDGFKRSNMENLFVMEFELSPESQQAIVDRVITPLKAKAAELGIDDSVVFPFNGDQGPHITAHVGKFVNMTPEEKQIALEWLKHSDETETNNPRKKSLFTKVQNAVVGKPITIDDAVFSGRDTYLSSSSFDKPSQETVLVARRIFELSMKSVLSETEIIKNNPQAEVKKHYDRYDDIIHISLMRLTRHVNPEALKSMVEEINKMANELKQNPLEVKVQNVNFIMAHEGIEKRMPSILT